MILLNLCDKILQTLKWDRTKFNTSIFSKISSTVKYGWLQVILRSWMMRVKCVTDFPYWIKSTIEWFFLSYVSFQNAPPQRSFKSSSFTVSEWLKLYFFFNQFRKKYIMMLWWRISIPPILRGWDYVWGQGNSLRILFSNHHLLICKFLMKVQSFKTKQSISNFLTN